MDNESFKQFDIIQIDGVNYYVENGDVAGGARLRVISDEDVIRQASTLVDGRERHKYLMDNSQAGRLTADGWQEKTGWFSPTVSDVSTRNWQQVYAPNLGTIKDKDPKIEFDGITDKNPGTMYTVTANMGNGDEEFTLKYGENETYEFISKNGVVYPQSTVEKVVLLSDVKVHAVDTRAYYTQSDGYLNLNSARTDGNLHARVNGTDSYDHPEIHDQYMHHTHVTETKNYDDLVATPGSVTVQTKDELVTGLTGANISSRNPDLMTLESGKTPLIERQWTAQDAKAYVGDIATYSNITFAAARPTGTTRYFTGKYEAWYAELAGDNSKQKADALKASVETLRNEFETVKNQMEDWYGSAADSAQDVIGCILGKFIVTMGNIENALIPACETIEKMVVALETMKTEDELLQTMLADYEAHINNKPPEKLTATRKVTVGKDKAGNPLYDYETYEYTNPEFTKWDNLRIEQEKAIEEQRLKLDQLVLEIEEYYLIITSYQQAVRQFSSFVSPTGSNHHMIATADAMVKYHDDILYEFENFARMPVITNLTDYKVGDIVMFDDGYGTLYKVTQAFDEKGNPLGYLKIIAVDKDGNPLKGAEEITIWDQREICPVGGKPSDIPTPTPTPSPKPTPPKPNPTPPKPTPPPPGPTSGPTPGPTPPPTTPPTSAPTPPPTTPPTVPPTPPPSRIPTPPPTQPPVPTDPYIPPDTGIGDMVGEAANSKVGLGALAGVALGAAGLGATIATGDKKSDDEEKKSE